MASSLPKLSCIPHLETHVFSTPSKKINDGSDLTFFLSSTAYRDILTWLLQLNRSMFPIKDSGGQIQQNHLDSPPPFSHMVENLRSSVQELRNLVDEAPPETGPRRFGNVAFRTWFKLVEERVDGLCDLHLRPILDQIGTDGEQRRSDFKDELKVYLLGSFGSAQRLDYGTGHELSFVAFLGCLWKVGAFEDGEERGIVVGVVQPYLELIRTLVQTYTLEPAGSHGVWGLDDHSFVPYIFGSAQYGPTIDPNDPSQPTPTEGSIRPSPAPSKVTDKAAVADYKDMTMYFSAIQFIYEVKRGPFWEHSPVLYDISGIKDGWAKINKGMLKMYAAEVLGKFPVVQHFPFGSLFRWESDPDAVKVEASVHAKEQPRGVDVPTALLAGGGGTKAPWAKAGGSAMPAVQASSGVPSTRAPWAGSRAPPAAASRQTPGTAATASSSGSNQRGASQGSTMPPPTTAPWAKKNGG